MEVVSRAAAATLQLLSVSALWLVLSFGVGGLIREFVPMEWMNRHLGHKGIMPVIYASIGGAIIPA